MIGLILWGPIHESRRLAAKKEELERQIADAKQRSIDLFEQGEALQNDPVIIEREARDRLNVARPGETIFKFPPLSEQEGSRP